MTGPALITTLLLALVALAEGGRSIPSITLAELKSDPLKYDGATVQITGWLTSGHVGVFVYDEAKQNSVRVRAAEELPKMSRSRLRKDNAYAEFWRLSDHEISKDTHPGVHVQFHAVVRVLKADGKPMKEFSALGQFPIELVPMRVLRVESRP